MTQEFIEDQLIILTKPTLDIFLKEKKPADLIALYSFYYYTAKWQKTNTIKANNKYVKKGLQWGDDRLVQTKNKLKELGLIEEIKRHGDDGKIKGYYIKINLNL